MDIFNPHYSIYLVHPSLTIYEQVVSEYIHVGFQVITLADDCKFTEGPVWNPEGYYLFSDIPANCIYRITANTSKKLFLANSGTANPEDPDLNNNQAGSNALAYDGLGNLLICQHGAHALAKFKNGELRPFINEFKGRPLNSPNDLILHNDGRIWFSDPPYGLKEGKLNPAKYQPLAGVYLWREERLELICDRYQYPNGVCLSPDQEKLYICSSKPFEKFISVYDTGTNSFMEILAEENSDGIECDRRGNIYLCSREGIIILSPEGKRLARIELPAVPSNLCWGGEGLNDLLVTARENVFLIRGLRK